ncbi:hypothetical protein H0H92_005281 [Tricholoma furcatifolium]|nr:hypothetical protein H0H92_005281 [Tricholoma furcatifolium]
MSVEELDYDIAAELLAQSCPESIKNETEIDIGSPQLLAYLLFRSGELRNLVKEAIKAGNFEDVWKECLSLAQPQESTMDRYLRRGSEVPSILGLLSSTLENLVNGGAELPLWSLERSTVPGVATIGLDSFAKKGSPPMLFHNLGSFQQDFSLKERVQSIFMRNRNTFLVNASASGKTRLLFEGLLQNWGLYFTARTDLFEASALDQTLRYGFEYETEIFSLPPSSSLSFDLTLARNREVAKRRFSLVLISHLLIFKEFLKVVAKSSGTLSDEHRHRWLVAQLWYPCLQNLDPYKNLLLALEWESSVYINTKLVEVLEEIRLLLPTSITSEGLFLVFDEANSALHKLWRSHPADTEEYPALKEIINFWKEQLMPLDIPITFVVAGTEIPFRYFPSSSREWSSWRWTSDTGAFDTSEAQSQYIASVLPASFLETPSGRALVRRAWEWCGSRHRFTASLVHVLLKDNLVHPHGVLNRYIKGLTSHEVQDADDFVALEGLYERASSYDNLGHVTEITGQGNLRFDTSKIELVTTGVGEFIDKDMKIIALEQRIPIIGVASYLSRYNRAEHKKYSLTSFETFCTYFQDRWPDGDTYVARNYIAFALAHVFAEGRALNEVFTIPNLPEWIGESSESANLVVLRKDATGIVRELVLDSSALHPSSPPLGFVASTSDDVIAWLNHERSAAFCCCPSECEAELIFILKIKQKNFWVVVRTAGRGTQTPDIDLYEEFGRLKLTDLFSDPTFSTRLSDAFNTLPNSAREDGNMSVLRVLASFPSEPQLLRNVAQRLKEPPAATLNNATFKSVTESIEGSTIIEALISSMQGKRGEYSDAMFNVIASKSRKPPSKTASLPSLKLAWLEDVKSKTTTSSNTSSATRRGRKMTSLTTIPPSPANRPSPPSPTTPTSPSLQKEKRHSSGSPKPYSRSRKGSGEAVVHTPILRRSPREHRVSESSLANRSPPALEAKAPSHASPTPPSPSLAKRSSPTSPSPRLSPLKRSSSASPKPHTKFRKGNTEKDMLSAEAPPILRRSPREHKVSDSSSKR